MRNLFNSFKSEPYSPTELQPSGAKVLVSDGSTVCSIDEPVNVFPTELTADAFSIKALQQAGVPIQQTGAGLIPAEIDEKAASAMRFGYDIKSRYLREQAEKAAKEKDNNQTVINFEENK